jgi:hypothetical protein
LGQTVVVPEIVEGLEAAGFGLRRASTSGDMERVVKDCIPAGILVGPGAGADPYARVRWLRSQERLAFLQRDGGNRTIGGHRPTGR